MIFVDFCFRFVYSFFFFLSTAPNARPMDALVATESTAAAHDVTLRMDDGVMGFNKKKNCLFSSKAAKVSGLKKKKIISFSRIAIEI